MASGAPFSCATSPARNSSSATVAQRTETTDHSAAPQLNGWGMVFETRSKGASAAVTSQAVKVIPAASRQGCEFVRMNRV
ncbi:Uncharacterised protein [Mycobacterium tuberculosis]|uniref:Uncharacterized protein n=1 Tax=Mycobacterium tuberculosis TaxID=1773 RepID=A0A0T7PR44_MYCTX|nr:Uncharacterised protein [Mycobacterium tuberculosis]CFS35034.1 Uncharacterised protein [Mycobacterium tuberculosis]COW18922.1 Uncharacterised protein [Mycobacterium tuberculosis]COW75029.1 Uncharacterised protein [Mycobacterium tuberculosis]COX15613.1 Uncharacterised protein [Mycobacterium tuberculosis]